MKLERAVLICAPATRVWSLVSAPGWWVGAQAPPREYSAGEVFPARHPSAGCFPVRIDKVESPTYVAFRWNCACAGVTPTTVNSTLVECRLRLDGDNVELSVSESGFQLISDNAAVCRKYLISNMEGWKVELAGLRARAEAQLN